MLDAPGTVRAAVLTASTAVLIGTFVTARAAPSSATSDPDHIGPPPLAADAGEPSDASASIPPTPLGRRIAARIPTLEPATGSLPRMQALLQGAGPSQLQSLLPNILVNNPAGETFGTGNTQMEPSLAASGDTLVCGFTDSRGLWGGGTLGGFAISFDAGVSWFDAGFLPASSSVPTSQVYGDPVMLTDGAGRWYCISVYDVGNGVAGNPGDLALVVHTAKFIGTTLQWSGPRIITGGGIGDDPESHHAVIDVARDRIYVTYTNQGAATTWGQIEIVTLGNHGATTLYTAVIQPHIDMVNNAGSQVAIGPNGEVYVVWENGVIGDDGQGPAYQMIARSLDEAATFEPPVVAATVYESWLSGPPGFNREEPFDEYPSFAIDTSNGPNRGRFYMTWNEGLPRDFSGTTATVNETGAPNDSPGTAQVLGPVSNMTINGSLPSGDYIDWYRFQGQAGDDVRFIVQPLSYIQLATRLWCANPMGGGADTLIAGSARPAGKYVHWLITLPYTGEYLVQLTRGASTGSYTAWLRKAGSTTPATATDHRDIVFISSDDGINWSPKTRVNDDTGSTDQAFPAMVVDGDGGVHIMWYDRRFDPRCRALAHLMMASSFDGGATFTPNRRVTTVSSFWQVMADAIPNFGDDFRPLAIGDRLYPAWADGRGGSPDVYVAPLRTSFEVTVPPAVGARVGKALDLAVTVRNDTPYDDAHFQVFIDSDSPLLPDSTIQVGPVSSGASDVAYYGPLVGGQIGVTTLAIIVTSDRSATVREDSVEVHDDIVAVRLSDLTSSSEAGGVRLSWRAFEVAGFDIERAATPSGSFERLTAAPLQGDGRGAFTFLDREPLTGQSYYRLLGYDLDGSVQTFGPYAVAFASPRVVALVGAQPNPFNPTTSIGFELPRAANVSLRILDVRGRLVATLLDHAKRDAGRHAVRWDGRSPSGIRQPSGVYVAELRALGTHRTSRLVLLR